MSNFVPYAIKRGFFAGSGSDAFNHPAFCEAALELTGKFQSSTKQLLSPICVAYLGTATYDAAGPRRNQTAGFSSLGCDVVDVSVAEKSASPPIAALANVFQSADLVVVSGGNTSYALRRWREVGIDGLLRQAAERGCVMAGGSAGAICWFDGGHSDSMDPATYKPKPSVGDAPSSTSAAAAATVVDESASSAPSSWEYIRVSGLGFLPGLCCPHYDRTQSNGIPRHVDFDAMHMRHRGEHAVMLDHWAALVIQDGGRVSVFSCPGKPGSLRVTDGAFVDDGSGVPAVWTQRIDDHGVVTRESLHQLLAASSEAANTVALSAVLPPSRHVEPESELETRCELENPTS